MSDEQYEARMSKVRAVRSYDRKIWMWVIAGLAIFVIANVQMQGGCEAMHQKQLEQEDRENKAWQAEQDRKARDEDVRRAREIWNRNP
jgi:hypothetical protein